ncbi:hypothetical protein BDZ94DRAFT_1275529, partial [Collybia nuda]
MYHHNSARLWRDCCGFILGTIQSAIIYIVHHRTYFHYGMTYLNILVAHDPKRRDPLYFQGKVAFGAPMIGQMVKVVARQNSKTHRPCLLPL